jgi:hypothetical protein
MLTLLLGFALGAALTAALTARAHRRQLRALAEQTRTMLLVAKGRAR